MIEGLLKLMGSPDQFTGPVNLGDPTEFSILELAKKVIALTGSKSKIILKPLPQDDPKQRKPDISLAREALGWGPKASLDEGLARTTDFFKQLIAAGRHRCGAS